LSAPGVRGVHRGEEDAAETDTVGEGREGQVYDRKREEGKQTHPMYCEICVVIGVKRAPSEPPPDPT
jgi:hypothetical protein